MKKLITTCSGIILLFSTLQLDAQNIKSNSLINGVCYAGNKVKKIYIPPPDEFFANRDTKGGASVTFQYKGFTTTTAITAKTTLEYAASVLRTLLPPDANITIMANWTKISTAGVLANSSTTGYAAGLDINALKPFALYPIALAEKINGKTLNPDADGDIVLNINNSINWYLGTDGNTPVTKYDLVTVVLHELIHGLGFFASMYSEDNLGSYGTEATSTSSSIPLIYDTFVENLEGDRLTDTTKFENPSVKLDSVLKGGQLYFNGPLLYNFAEKRAKLWAPPTFDAGSSVSHLDENSYLRADSDGLMTPFIDKGEAIHNPGRLTMSILGDLGWINTRIIHEPHKDTEENLSDLEIKALIKSDTTFYSNSVSLVWSVNDFTSSDTVLLSAASPADTFKTTISIPSYNTKLDYYLFVKDHFARIYRLPSYIEKNKFSVYIGTDTVKPVITHTPVEYYLEKIDSLRFNAKVTDNIGIDTVYVEYKLNDGPVHQIGLMNKGNDSFRNAVSTKVFPLHGGDSLKYRIVAFDSAEIRNQQNLPENDYYFIKIEKINPVAESYTTDFNDASGDFLNLGFNILQTTGFSGKGLHTKHPYDSPEENGDSLNFISFLRTPVKVDSTGIIIRFKEIVLVEPGEPGSLFGSQDFYDYVIVEGSKNFGNTWFRVADGYDSRYNASWLTAYNSAMDGMNSIYEPKESMLVQHTFDSISNSHIAVGDTMMIRFRLFSDPYANGWGWVIDDLHIGPNADAIEDIAFQPFLIYPNPGNGLITLREANGSSGKPVKYYIYNSTGICILSGFTDGGEFCFIDISGNPSGIYFIMLYRNDGIRTLKYSLIK